MRRTCRSTSWTAGGTSCRKPLSHSAERRQRSPGSVEMVDTPPAEPGAVMLLLVEQPPQPALRRIAVAVLTAECLECMRGHVGARLVRHLAEVAERDLVEPHGLVVDVERAPAAALRLHADDPVEPAALRGRADAELAQRERDDRRVVDVPIEVVLELDSPAARG